MEELTCNNRGILQNGECRCNSGFGGVNCEDTWKDEYPAMFTLLRSANIICTTIALALCTLNIIYTINKKRVEVIEYQDRQETLAMKIAVGNRSMVVLITFLVWLTMDWLVWVIDPYNFQKLLPYGMYLFMTDFGIVMGSIYILALIDHLISFILLSKKLLKQEQMKEKINKSYESKVTIETVLEDPKAKRLTYANLGINIILFLIQIFMTIMHALHSPLYLIISMVLFFGATLIYIGYAISTVFIWFKLVKFLDLQLERRKQILPKFRKVCAVSAISAINAGVSIIVSLVTTWSIYFHWIPFSVVLKYMATFIALSIFNPSKFSKYLYVLPGSYSPSRRTISTDSNNISISETFESIRITDP